MPRPDPSNLAAWYATHAAPLTLYARQFTPSPEDAVHEAFVHLLSQPRTPDNIKAWLYTTTRNAALSNLRTTQRRDRRERAATESRPEWFIPRPDDLIDATAAQAALSSLPADQRETVVLRIYAQASFAEIASITGRPLSSVYDQYKTALATLKRKMESPCPTKITT